MKDDKLGTKAAASYLGISVHTLGKWCSAKRIPYYKVGKERSFKKEDLDKFVESRRVEAAK